MTEQAVSETFVHLIDYKGQDVFVLPSLVKGVWPGMAGESVINLGNRITIAVKGSTGEVFGQIFGTSNTTGDKVN